ncbi:calcium/sodium antiporter [Allohahella sp. A8]|uniref:calcium/sodium antiporter n=1 Tax=Allohahella sp. A8 TaxID=3141461 RepID=UPI000C09C186|nr:calcium/sodium antiporter [Hahellaceae bacterium]|tara:strand:- start:10871 stop:11914 length:1044 start_codon:yes stop_codon:yes gene_type:complete
MLLAIFALIAGLIVLVWSADRFIDGAVATAAYAGMPPLLIGMVVIGFGTSAPEMLVSAIAALQGNPALALGNALGSNIANIGLILGITALLSPILVQRSVLLKELPLLLGITAVFTALLIDGDVSRLDAWIMVAVFAATMAYSIVSAMKKARQDRKDQEDSVIHTSAVADDGVVIVDGKAIELSRRAALWWLVLGLVLLTASSRVVVYGAVSLATSFGVSDVIVGLTVVAVGTSLPELAAAIAAVKKNEHDLALGNVVGSNMFNTLLVVGIAGLIQPMELASEVIVRDLPVMIGFTVLLFLMSISLKPASHGTAGRIGRVKGGALTSFWVLYTCYLVYIAFLQPLGR